MKQRRNRRTLKKRIRRALSLTAFISVLFLTGVIIFLSITIIRNLLIYQSNKVCLEIQADINSGHAARLLGIKGIGELDSQNPKTKAWIQTFVKNSIIDEMFRGSKDIGNVLCIKIQIDKAIVYSNEDDLSRQFSDMFKDTEAVKPLFDQYFHEIGTVSVKVNGFVSILIIGVILFIIFMLSLAALIISKVLNMFLVIPVINPINQLVTKVRAIADGDQETASGTQLVLKRPLREIESLIDSTNNIMKKLHGYNEMLENQKEQLENQNLELEMQNEELTESKQHIQEQQAQLVQSEKMASVGMLTAAITHEINTPIGAINSNAQLEEMLINQLKDNPTIQQNEELVSIFAQLKDVNDVNLMACSRIIEIIKSLKSFSRLDQAEFQEANINEGIKSVLVLTHNLLKRRITVHENYEDIPPVKCYPGQLNQVIMNIIVNASQAIEGEGEIFIHTYRQEKDIYISIKDTGVGIKQEDISKLFNPGFTTKGVGIGLGLGLYISYNIIQNHKGEISVISEPGQGAEFIIRIPMENDKT